MPGTQADAADKTAVAFEALGKLAKMPEMPPQVKTALEQVEAEARKACDLIKEQQVTIERLEGQVGDLVRAYFAACAGSWDRREENGRLLEALEEITGVADRSASESWCEVHNMIIGIARAAVRTEGR